MNSKNDFVKSLYFKLFITISTILIVSSFFSYAFISSTTKSQILETEKTFSNIYSSAVGKSMLSQLLFSDPAVFQGLISSLVDGEHIHFAYILNSNDEIIVHTFSPLIPQDIISEVNYEKAHNTIDTEQYGEIIVSSQPLFYGMQGYLVLGLAKPELKFLWYKIATIMFSVSILLIGFITIVINRSVMQPLMSINRAISQIDEDGIPSSEIPTTKTKEINHLSTTMTSMVKSISSSREALKKSEAQFRALIESTSDHIWEVDVTGKYTYSSPQIVNLSGYTVDEIIGKYAYDILSPESALNIQTLLQELIENQASFNSVECIIVKKDGTETIIENSGVPFFENGILIGFRGIARDISMRKKSEAIIVKTNEELKIHKEHLEDLVNERTSELEKSLSQLQEAQGQLIEAEKMASLGGLVAGVAHEINTPVGIGVTASSHIRKRALQFEEKYNSGNLSRKDFTQFVHDAVEDSNILLTNMERAADLIKSFKQVAVDQTSDDIRELELEEYLNELLSSLHPKLKKTKHQVILEIPEKIYVKTVAGAISQIFTNLIMNSLLHGFGEIEKGTITISIKSVQNQVLVEYRDSGCGIPTDHISKVFEPFFTTKRGKGGTGLGMHILYNLITQRLKGRVICHNREQQGEYFEISLPDHL